MRSKTEKVQREVERVSNVFLRSLEEEQIPVMMARWLFPVFSREWRRRSRSGESRSIRAMRPIMRTEWRGLLRSLVM